MTEKELKKLTRKQLLELLLRQTERADKLEEELKEARQKIQDRNLMQSEAGSIAAASLKLNGVFEAAEAAASQYLENIAKLSEDHELVYERAKAEAKEKADALLEQTEKLCSEAEAKADKAQKKLEEIEKRIREIYEQKKMLDDFFVCYNSGSLVEKDEK